MGQAYSRVSLHALSGVIIVFLHYFNASCAIDSK
jgi:hypothetical protein